MWVHMRCWDIQERTKGLSFQTVSKKWLHVELLCGCLIGFGEMKTSKSKKKILFYFVTKKKDIFSISNEQMCKIANNFYYSHHKKKLNRLYDCLILNFKRFFFISLKK